MAIAPNTDNFIAQNTNDGSFYRCYSSFTGSGAKTAATTTSGLVTGQRFPDPLVLPSSMTSNGMILTNVSINVNIQVAVGAFLEVNLGSINMNTGTFTDGSAMPSRRIVGDTGTQTMGASIIAMVSTAAITATTPTVTITYVNQAGTGSRSAAPVLPTSPVLNSAFMLAPHLQAGDTGIQDITNITKSAGTAGTLTVYGLYPLWLAASTNNATISPDVWNQPWPNIVLEESDNIAFYAFGSTSASMSMVAMISGIGDT